MDKGWNCLDCEDGTVHVLPIDDLRDHEDKGSNCWCNPKIDLENKLQIVIHNSMDGREILENIDLKKKDIPNHLALVAKYWFPYSVTDDINVAIALKWLQKRYKYLLPTLGVTESEVASLVAYFDVFLKSLIEGN